LKGREGICSRHRDIGGEDGAASSVVKEKKGRGKRTFSSYRPDTREKRGRREGRWEATSIRTTERRKKKKLALQILTVPGSTKREKAGLATPFSVYRAPKAERKGEKKDIYLPRYGGDDRRKRGEVLAPRPCGD